MYNIPEEFIDMVVKWSERVLLPNDNLLSKLKEIGATPPDLYGNLKEYIRIPCKCVTKLNEEIDFCIVSFQRFPPDYHQRTSGKKIIFIDELVDVLESEYALNRQVRLATTKAQEVRMGFSPTFVTTPDDKLFILGGITDFFECDGYKGKDITLPKEDIYLSEKRSIFYKKGYYEKITWVIADWKDEYKQIRI